MNKLLKLVFTIFLSASLYCVAGQTSQDTLLSLKKKAADYLHDMYCKQDFKTASQQWTDSICADITEIYQNKGKFFQTNEAIMQQTILDYDKFYAVNKNFALRTFDDAKINHEGNSLSAFIQYSFTEELNGKQQNGSSFISFFYNAPKKEWQVFDFRISDILRMY
jgi:hypothetical protein